MLAGGPKGLSQLQPLMGSGLVCGSQNNVGQGGRFPPGPADVNTFSAIFNYFCIFQVFRSFLNMRGSEQQRASAHEKVVTAPARAFGG